MHQSDITYKDMVADEELLVVIKESAFSRMKSFTQSRLWDKEAAGVLIGERRAGNLVVCEVTEPGKGDKRSRHSVDRRGPHHQQAVDQAFERSNGTLQYLGEWHTHPEDYPTPSPKDYNSWGKGLNFEDPMIVLIIGRKSTYVGKKVRNVIRPLSLVPNVGEE
ncbi:Mov34/MPN/PAD-1 family protein [Shewanella algae]|uniref:Mov34/MPN/PAD-1 family protein n=1 Tax=Shewanella algae TaxID=38313 RepID=UPI0031F4DB7C